VGGSLRCEAAKDACEIAIGLPDGFVFGSKRDKVPTQYQVWNLKAMAGGAILAPGW